MLNPEIAGSKIDQKLPFPAPRLKHNQEQKYITAAAKFY